MLKHGLGPLAVKVTYRPRAPGSIFETPAFSAPRICTVLDGCLAKLINDLNHRDLSALDTNLPALRYRPGLGDEPCAHELPDHVGQIRSDGVHPQLGGDECHHYLSGLLCPPACCIQIPCSLNTSGLEP